MDTSSCEEDSDSLMNAALKVKLRRRFCGIPYPMILITLFVSSLLCMVGLIILIIEYRKLAEQLQQIREHTKNIPSNSQQVYSTFTTTPTSLPPEDELNDKEKINILSNLQQVYSTFTTTPTTLPPEDELNDKETMYKSGGTTYVHWGKSSCHGDAVTLYSGIAASSSHSSKRLKGGGVEYLCLPQEPEWNKYDTSNDTLAYSWLYASEYLTFFVGIFKNEVHGQNAVCSLCWVPRTAKVMIPAHRSCPSSDWTLQYEGYLMSSMITQTKSSFECVDAQPEYINGTAEVEGGALFYFVSGYCSGTGGLNICPPYIHGRELTCAVCTL